MATKAPLGSLYAEGPEEQKLADEIKGSYAKLREALEARQNPLFDPVLLAMSQGFLTPTKTGSFGEVLGNVAAQIGPAQQAEQKRAQEIAAMKMELAQNELAQRQATRTEGAFRGLLESMAPSAPAGAAPASGAAPAAGTAPVSGAAPSGGAAQGRPVTSLDIAKLASMPGGAERAKILADMMKMDRDRFKVEGGIITDLGAPGGPRVVADLRGATQKQEVFETKYGDYPLTPAQFTEYLAAEKAGQGKAYIDALGLKKAGERQRATEVEQKTALTTAEARAKAEAARYEDFINKGAGAGQRIAQFNTLEQLASSPDAKKYLGVFEDPNVSSAILKLAETGGKGLPNIQEIRDIFINLGLDKNVKADQLYAQQLIALANLELRKMTRSPGEGAQSDLETRMAIASGLDRDNSPEGLVKKVRFLRAREEFNRGASRALQSSKMNANEFINSDAYDNLLSTYEKKLSSIIGPSASGAAARPQGAAPRPPGAAASAPYSAAREKLLRELGQ